MVGSSTIRSERRKEIEEEERPSASWVARGPSADNFGVRKAQSNGRLQQRARFDAVLDELSTIRCPSLRVDCEAGCEAERARRAAEEIKAKEIKAWRCSSMGTVYDGLDVAALVQQLLDVDGSGEASGVNDLPCMSPSAPRSATKSPRVRTASPQPRRVITLDSYEESKGEDAEAEVARLEAQLAEARRRAYEKRTGAPSSSSSDSASESSLGGCAVSASVLSVPVAVSRVKAAAALISAAGAVSSSGGLSEGLGAILFDITCSQSLITIDGGLQLCVVVMQ